MNHSIFSASSCHGTCSNGGTFNRNLCACDCPRGFYGKSNQKEFVLETFRVSLEGQDFKFNALAGSGSVVSFLILA